MAIYNIYGLKSWRDKTLTPSNARIIKYQSMYIYIMTSDYNITKINSPRLETSITVQSSPVILDTFLMSQCVPHVVSVIPPDPHDLHLYTKPCLDKPWIVCDPLIPFWYSPHPFISHTQSCLHRIPLRIPVQSFLRIA